VTLLRAFDTPIDAALPLVVVLIALWAWLIRESRWMHAVLAAAPLLVTVEMAVEDERLRLLLLGIVTAAAFAVALFVLQDNKPRWILLGLSATFLLRWIPLAGVEWVKELLVLACVGALLALVRARTPLMMAVVLAVALLTPIHPGRMAFYPLAVGAAQFLLPWPLAGAGALFLAALAARYSHAALYAFAAAALLAPLATRRAPLATRVVLVFAALTVALWPWSGAVSRLLPLPAAGTAVAAVTLLAISGRLATIAGSLLLVLTPALFAGAGHMESPQVLGAALTSAQSLDVDVDKSVRTVVLKISGANMQRLRPGRVVGRIEARDRAGRETTRVLRIGDVADFGFLRREQFFFSRNVPPRNGSGDLREYGNASFLYGAGRIPIRFAAPATRLRVTAAEDLPGGARLQVESVEYRTE